MQRHRPLPDSNPEFTVLDLPGYREYRVENLRISRNGGNIVSNALWVCALVPLPLLIAISGLKDLSVLQIIVVTLLSLSLVWVKCTQVLYESVVILPPHGIQLETCRGFSSLPLTTTRIFIPFAAIHDVVINEALKGWNVRYYLAAVERGYYRDFSLEVAFHNILPHQRVLLEVYHGIHEFIPSVKRRINVHVG